MSTVASLYETFTRGGGAALTHLFLKSLVWLLAAWALHASLRRWKIAWRLYLWRVTAIGLLILPLLTWVECPVALRFSWLGANLAPVHLVQDETPVKPNAVGMPNLAPMAAVPSQASWDAEPPATTQNESARGAELERTPDRARSELFGWLKARSVVEIVVGVWGLGAAGLLLRLMMGAWSARLLVKRSAPVADGVLAQAKAMAVSLGIRQPFHVREVSSSRLSSPVLSGVAQPVLLIPGEMVERADERELAAVLAHELAHLRGNDLRWNLLMRLCSMLYWPNPLAWGMRRAHLGACECQADAVSARACGGEDVYSQILATIALRVHGHNRQPGLAMARRSQVLWRIERLPRTLREKPVRRRFLVMVGACASAVALLLGTARVVGAEETPSATPTQSDAIVAESLLSKSGEVLSAQEAGSMLVRVVDEDGNPLPGAKLKSKYSWKGPDPDFPVELVQPGVFRVGFPKDAGSLPGVHDGSLARA
jgi:beta-lactamase regulating signal transducer with metallopeptidase domain